MLSRYVLPFLLVLLVSGTAMAGTLYVPYNHSTIQSAINAAEPGDTIQVANGVYNESGITVNKSLTIIGAGRGEGGTVIQPSASATVFTFTSGGITLKNMDIVIGGTNSDRGIQFSGSACDRFTVDNVGFFVNDNGKCIDVANHITNITINDCYFKNNGIKISVTGNITGLTLTNNTFEGSITTPTIGFYVAADNNPGGNDNGILRNALIQGNKFFNFYPAGWPGIGFYAEEMQNVDFFANTFSNCYVAIHIYKNYAPGRLVSDIVIDGNTIHDCSYGLGLQNYKGFNGITLTNNNIACALNAVDAAGFPDAPGWSTFAMHQNNILGRVVVYETYGPITLDCTDNWWGIDNPAGIADLVEGHVNYAEAATKAFGNDALYLSLPNTVFAQTNTDVIINMSVANLSTMVSGCQALLGFDSTYLTNPVIQAAGGYWNDVIYANIIPVVDGGNSGIDTAIGLKLEDPNPLPGTDEDGKVAIIRFKTGAKDGKTRLVFRPDIEPCYATMLCSVGGQVALYPSKVDAPMLVIDGTPPEVLNFRVYYGTWVSSGATLRKGEVSVRIDSVSDEGSGIDSTKTLVEVFKDGSVVASGAPTGNPSIWKFNIDETWANGDYVIHVSATDRAGNKVTKTFDFTVNKNEVKGQIALENFTTSSAPFRNVTFVLNGGTATEKEIKKNLRFTNGVASYSFTDADYPGMPEIISISAKTDWNLRKKLTVTPVNGQSVADFTGENQLMGGDINNDNFINILDYGVLKEAWFTTKVGDINGDTVTNTDDYNIMKLNWFKSGDER